MKKSHLGCVGVVEGGCAGRMGTRSGALEDQDWYHGMLPRTEITQLLRKHGDWLVRSTEKGIETRIVITVRWKDDVKHIMLKKDRNTGGFRMPQKVFPTAVDLVEYFRRKPRPLNEMGITLAGRPIKRRKWMIPNKDVSLEMKVGEGQFGEVFVGKLRHKDLLIPVALKTCKLAMNRDEQDEFLKEAKLMLNYRHINVVRLYGVAADKQPIMLVMENCPSGGLDSHLKKHKTLLNQRIRYCVEAARGMEYLAVKKDCVHRDLAARNCLIGFKGEIKIADFGLSQKGTYIMTEAELKTSKLPIKWMAPESFLQGCFSYASDIWSFGILMWEIFADAQTPWPGKGNLEAAIAMRDGIKLEMPTPEPPEEIQQLMNKCWASEPGDRPGITELKEGLEAVGGIYNVQLPPSVSIGSRSSGSSGQKQKTL